MPFNPFKVKPIPIHAHSPVEQEDDNDEQAVAQHLEQQAERNENRQSNPFRDEQTPPSPPFEYPTPADDEFESTPMPTFKGNDHNVYESVQNEQPPPPIFTHPQPSFATSAPSYTGTSYSYDPSSVYHGQPHSTITPVPVTLPQSEATTNHPLAYDYDNIDLEKQYIGDEYQFSKSRSPSPEVDSYEGLYNDDDDSKIATPAPEIKYNFTPEMDTAHYGAPPEERMVRRGKTKKRIPLTDGNLVIDLPVPSTLDKVIMRRDLEDMQSVRYTAVTCDPDHFEKNQFTLRQQLANRRTEL